MFNHVDSSSCNSAWFRFRSSFNLFQFVVPCSSFCILLLSPVILPLQATILSCISTLPPFISIWCLSLTRCLCILYFVCLGFWKVLPHTHTILGKSTSVITILSRTYIHIDSDFKNRSAQNDLKLE